MKLDKTIMITQSSKTGRILLQKRGEVWGFSSEMKWDDEAPMLFNGLNQVKSLLGMGHDDDEILIDYVGTLSGIQIFHLVVEQEPCPCSSTAEWFSLLNFPEPFDISSNALFENHKFVDKLISPKF